MLSSISIKYIKEDLPDKLRLKENEKVFALDLACKYNSEKTMNKLWEYKTVNLAYEIGLINIIKRDTDLFGKISVSKCNSLLENKLFPILDELLKSNLIKTFPDACAEYTYRLVRRDNFEGILYLDSKKLLSLEYELVSYIINKDDLTFFKKLYEKGFEQAFIDVKMSTVKACSGPNFPIKSEFHNCFKILNFLMDEGFSENLLSCAITIDHNFNLIKHIITRSFEKGFWIDINCTLRVLYNVGRKRLARYIISLLSDYKFLDLEFKILFFQLKYYRRWRLIHWKKFFRKVVIPLYYSPGFAGGGFFS